MAMTTVFTVHPQPAQANAAHSPQRVIKVRGANPVYAAGEFPNPATRGGPAPRFTLFEDAAGQKPLCHVAPRTGADGALAVTGPDGAELGALSLPARGSGRTRYEMALPDGTRLVGRGGTIGAWILYVVLSPLVLIYNVAGLVGGYGGPDWHLPTRTAWRSGPGPAPLKFYGMTDKYKVRTGQLDLRVAYAQAVLHEWSG